jgi:hypothetical protein
MRQISGQLVLYDVRLLVTSCEFSARAWWILRTDTTVTCDVPLCQSHVTWLQWLTAVNLDLWCQESHAICRQARPVPGCGETDFGWRMMSSGMLRRVALVRADVSEELSASFIRVTRIGELWRTLAVTSNRRTLRRNTKWLTWYCS